MVILKSRVNGQDVQYSVVRVAVPAEMSGSIVPDANGPRYGAVCRKCGFGVASTFPGHAIQLLLFSVASGHDHHHSTTASHFRVDPTIIDRIYEAFRSAQDQPWPGTAGMAATA